MIVALFFVVSQIICKFADQISCNMRLLKLLTLFLTFLVCSTLCAQDWYRVHRHYNDYGFEWQFPYSSKTLSYFDFSRDGKTMVGHQPDDEESLIELAVPFSVSYLDSITFGAETPEELQTHDKYKVFAINITTENSAGVTSKEDYVPCIISVDGKGEYDDFSATAQIRGRGNSTWKWYDKKPYRIKLDEKHKILGLDKEKDWVLLANFRDPTDLMNAFVFEVVDWMGMKHVNHTRFVELFIDGDYRGIYQLTEQIEQGKNRVDVADEGGILLGMDADDGPELSPTATNNFWSKVYNMPMCIKYPKEPTQLQIDSIKTLLATLETAISNADYAAVDSLIDMKSFMVMAMIQEYVENVEICAPRSIYMYKDVDGKWFMGPFWDWDAGYDFDWGYMYAGHKFFGNYKELVLGTDPGKRKGMYGGTPRFFTDMFKDDGYTKEYKALWNSVSDSILTRNWSVMEKYIANLEAGPYERDFKRWPITDTGESTGKTVNVKEQITKMHTWLENRTTYLNKIINAYPETGGGGGGGTTTDPGVKNVVYDGAAITVNAIIDQAGGYSQSFTIDLDASKIAEQLGCDTSDLESSGGDWWWGGGSSSSVSLKPLNADGTEGNNTAAKTYGAWFDKNGNTNSWGSGHVYIESDSMCSWACGCHPDNSESGEKNTVRMQYKYNKKTVTVTVNFGLDVDPTK